MTMNFRNAFAFFRVAPLAVAASLALAPAARACTSFLLKAADGSPVYGRTMEFGYELESRAIFIPRNFKLRATGKDGGPSWSWQTRYAVVGLDALSVPDVVDGMNEKGLAGGILYFPGFAGYADASTADPKRALAPWEFLTFILTNYASVAEAREGLKGVSIIGVAAPGLGKIPPFHYTLHDASGASLVIEPVDGALKVYDNPLGVMTNSPPFDWHLTNLRNYVKLSPVDAAPLEVEGQAFAPLGAGSGLLGVPGDPTPPSRFVRALGLALSAERQENAARTVRLAEHILNNFDIPSGFIRPRPAVSPKPNETEEKAGPEFTQWSAIADLSGKIYYVKTYEDQTLRRIDLMKFDPEGKTIRVAPLKAAAPPALEFSKR